MDRTPADRARGPRPAAPPVAWLWALALAALVVVLAPARALARDVWTEPNPGVRHLYRSTPAPAEFHALIVDTNVPGVAIRCTSARERWRATSRFAREAHLAAAVNGGFWGLIGQGAQGMAAGAGAVWSGDNDELGFFAVGRDGRAWISRPEDVVDGGSRGIREAVSGRPLIVDRGRVAQELWGFERRNVREPRSSVGVSQDGKTIYIVTVDGRRATSHGGTLVEMAELLIELGAYRGINLDGGGSTTLYVANDGGVVNRPSRGWEREVLNHIGVVAPAHPPAAATTRPARVERETPREVVDRALARRSRGVPADFEAGEGTGVRGWIRSRFGRLLSVERLHIGRYREVVVPAFFLAVLLFGGGVVWLIVRRVRRRMRARAAAERAPA